MIRIVHRICIATASCLLLGTVCLASAGYELRNRNGYIAVWDSSSSDWIYQSDVPVSSLPEADRRQIQNGLSVSSGEALSSLLEDFCS